MLEHSRILIVDDDLETRELLREIVTKEGYQVEAVEDAEAAIDKVSQHPPDVVISDIHMP